MTDQPSQNELLELTTEIVAAHVSNTSVSVDNLPALIQSVHGTLSALAAGGLPAEKPTPAVNPKKSIFPDYIVCLEDGKKLKMLKRHLMTSYGLTPEQYRERWGLAVDYPMTAPSYAKRRSQLAKKIGLGTKPRVAKAKTKVKAKTRAKK